MGRHIEMVKFQEQVDCICKSITHINIYICNRLQLMLLLLLTMQEDDGTHKIVYHNLKACNIVLIHKTSETKAFSPGYPISLGF